METVVITIFYVALSYLVGLLHGNIMSGNEHEKELQQWQDWYWSAELQKSDLLEQLEKEQNND